MAEPTIDTIGCDLGDTTSELYVLKGGEKDGHRVPPVKTTREAMTTVFKGLKPAHVVIEVGTHSRWVSQLLKDLGHRPTVSNPRAVKLISESTKKTDKRDAALLARLGRADVALLSPIEHRGNQAQADLAVAKARDGLVRARTRLVSQIRMMVKSFGERLGKCDAAHFTQTLPALPPILEPALAPLYEVLETLDKKIAEYDAKIDQLAKKYPEVELVTQPMGVGNLTGLVFVLTIEDKTRFKESRLVGPYLGLVPKNDKSGKIDKQLPITKAGDPFVRRLLVNSAAYILRKSSPASDLKDWGLHLKGRGGTAPMKKAQVAVARKLGVLMHRLWVTGEKYQPVGYAAKKQSPKTTPTPKKKAPTTMQGTKKQKTKGGKKTAQ
ncbi:MAG: IS110 family transposase [Myxococcales bacterium]